MRRRGGQGQACSLFAFQDVMASVIGILFFVVILVSLDIVEQEETLAGRVAGEPATEKITQLRAAIQQKEKQRQSLEQAIAKQRALFDWAHGGRADLVRKEIEGLEQTLHQATQQAEEARNKVKDTNSAKTDKQKQLLRIQAEWETLKKKKEGEAKKLPRVVFHVEPRADGLEPWLVEIAATGIRVSPKDQARVIKTFGTTSANALYREFMQWALSQDPKRRYFVLLIKPSGIRSATTLEQILKSKGFRIGRDLLPENWQTFSNM